MNSNTIWMWVGIVLLGGIAVLRVQAALTPEEESSSRRGSARSEVAETDEDELDTTLELRSYEPGDCVTWDQSGAWEDTRVVPCGEDHLLEIVGPLEHPARTGDPLPTDWEWSLFFGSSCGPMVSTYLEGRLDPAGSLRPAGIHPLIDSWREGNRTVWCGIGGLPPEGSEGFPILRARAVDIDQSRVYDPGTCFEVVEHLAVVVGCDQPHHYLAIGELDLAERERFPSDEELQSLCAEATGRTQGDRGRHVSFVGFEPTSWKVGSRRGTCVLGVFDENGAPVLQQSGVLQG